MLGWSIVFVLSAIAVGYVGFSSFDDQTASGAQILFWFLLAMGMICAALSTLQNRSQTSTSDGERESLE